MPAEQAPPPRRKLRSAARIWLYMPVVAPPALGCATSCQRQARRNRPRLAPRLRPACPTCAAARRLWVNLCLGVGFVLLFCVLQRTTKWIYRYRLVRAEARRELWAWGGARGSGAPGLACRAQHAARG
jgi:hypothetical protein